MSNQASKRHTVFIDKAFQGRSIAYILLLILLSAVCSALLIYWLGGGELRSQTQSAHLNVLESLQHLGISILLGNVVAMLIAGGLAVFVVLYASHKIAGPLYRFEKLCEHIGNGQLDMATSLREGDQLQDMGKAFAEMVAKLRDRKEQHARLVGALNDQLEQLQKDPVVTTNHSAHLEQMRQTLAELEK